MSIHLASFAMLMLCWYMACLGGLIPSLSVTIVAVLVILQVFE